MCSHLSYCQLKRDYYINKMYCNHKEKTYMKYTKAKKKKKKHLNITPKKTIKPQGREGERNRMTEATRKQ